MKLILHYAPDNASLCVRLTLEELRLPFSTALLERRKEAQRSARYLALNPHGLIPVLETSDGPLFETAAILLWLADQRSGVFPAPGSPERGRALSWLFWLSNSLHPALRALFYPDQPPFAAAEGAQLHLTDLLDRAEAHLLPVIKRPDHLLLSYYLCPMLRWLALYPKNNHNWFELRRWPGLQAMAQITENRPAAQRAADAEGLGATPFSSPQYATPPEGSAT